MTRSAARPSMAARPFAISTAGVNMPKLLSLAAPLRTGKKEATVVRATRARMGAGASANCLTTDSSELNSAARAATMATIARRPLTTSGMAPLKAMASPRVGVAVMAAVTDGWATGVGSTLGASAAGAASTGAAALSSSAEKTRVALMARLLIGAAALATNARVLVAEMVAIMFLKNVCVSFQIMKKNEGVGELGDPTCGLHGFPLSEASMRWRGRA
mmetsp:Transcript_13380/g.38792  ORF Transcript_13380/g.38792 Transcript_13380/m.38792 type:complete len:217 (-) Transcript_13380:1362-2012(-)